MNRSKFDLDNIVEKLVVIEEEKNIEHKSNHTANYHGGNKNRKSTRNKPKENYEKSLSSYEEVSKSNWRFIEPGTYIRWLTLDGELKKGGKVNEITVNKDGSLSIVITKFAGKPMRFTINTKTITNIYKRIISSNMPNSNINNSTTPKPQINTQINNLPTDSTNSTITNDVVTQLGDKILFGDIETLNSRVDVLEASVQKQQDDLRRLFLLVKKALIR